MITLIMITIIMIERKKNTNIFSITVLLLGIMMIGNSKQIARIVSFRYGPNHNKRQE